MVMNYSEAYQGENGESTSYAGTPIAFEQTVPLVSCVSIMPTADTSVTHMQPRLPSQDILHLLTSGNVTLLSA